MLLTGKIFCCGLGVLVPGCVTPLLLFVIDYVTQLLLCKIFVFWLLVALLLLTNAQVFDQYGLVKLCLKLLEKLSVWLLVLMLLRSVVLISLVLTSLLALRRLFML